ncbi:conserved Plasmodium protein, unknown function [Plasmodium ovale wallikeri]|uniref:Rad21/Rec8-like protein N-terminal domain-containing protein n=2 Tax=Plasmodium ovale TaxID=36330 RepID=A0A1C3KUT7_PLAOA|nr:conserved Plasmodium protein, unknown function [Plasmodium ovale wallikeri]SBT77954.1 conserved Plasmodium protein, unknown function [Plasmodium ovale]
MDVLRQGDILKPRIKRSRSIIEREEGSQENSHNNQVVLYGNSFKNNSLCYAWNAYFDKNKIKKNIMICCDLNKICSDILKGVENNSLTIKTFSFLLIGVCNIYKKKVHFIGQDYEILKRKIISLYKNKDQNLNDLMNSKDGKRRKIGKDNEDQNSNKKRLNRTSLNIKRGSIGLKELMPSVIDDFTRRKSRFSLNADEISIAGTQHNSYNDIFNENEMNNQVLMDISGLNYLHFDNDNNGDSNNNNFSSNYHDMERALEGSYVSRNSIPINHFDGLHLNRALSESFNPMDNLNVENSILNNMIPKNMFPNLGNSLNEKSMSGGDYNNFEMNSVRRSDTMSPTNLYNGVEKDKAVNRGSVNGVQFPHDYANVGDVPRLSGSQSDNGNAFHHPFSSMNGRAEESSAREETPLGVANYRGSSGGDGDGNGSGNDLNHSYGRVNGSRDFHNLAYNNTPSPNGNWMGTFHNMHTPVNGRNDLYNLNPFMNMHSMNNNPADNRNNYVHFSQRINNTFGDVDAMSNVMVGSIFSPQKKKNMSKKNEYMNTLNFETYQNFDYFEQKDDDAFIKKLNTLLGLDESDEEKDKENVDYTDREKNANGEVATVGVASDQDDVDRSRGKFIEMEKESANKESNNRVQNLSVEEEEEKEKQIIIHADRSENTPTGKKRKLEKHIIDRNYMMKESVMRGMLKKENIDYKHFLIDTINNEISEKIQREYPKFQPFFFQTNNDKVKSVHKLEINFGYELLDIEKKQKMFENYLSFSINDKSYLYENKNVLNNFSIKKCLDNIDEYVISSENDNTLPMNFLSMEDHEEGTMKSDTMHFEEVQEQFNGVQLETQNGNINELKNRFSIDPLLSQNEPIDLHFNDLNFRDDLESRIHLESQMSKSLVMYRDDEQSINKSDDLQNIPVINDKLNWEFNSSPLDISVSSNYDFSNIFTKDNESSLIDDKEVEVDINLNQDFDLIAKELLEVYKNLSTKINYIFFDLITKNRKSKDEISILFYITLHLANMGYIHIMQKPILPEQLNYYEENFARPILIQYINQKKDS